MAWWTKIGDEVKKHDGRKPKLSAAIWLNFAHTMSGVPLSKLHLYKRDPTKFPDEPDLFPAEMEKARKRAVRGRR